MVSNWVKYKIKDVCSVTDCKHDTAPVVNYKTDYKMLRTTNIKNGFIDVEDVDYVTEETYIKWSARGFLEKGDIILTREAPIGEVGIIKTDDKLFLGQRLLQLKAKKDIVTPEFLHYSLLSPYFQNQIRRSNNTGSTVSNVKIPELKEMDIPLPSITVQKQISEILENIDNKIFVNNQINKELEYISKTLYNYWFIQFEFPNEEGNPYKSSGGKLVWNEELKRKIPDGWEVASFCDNKYTTFSKEKVEMFIGQKSYIATGDVDGVDINGNLEQITFEQRPSRANSQPVVNTIWFAKMKDSKKLLLLTENDEDLIESTILSTGFSGLKIKNDFLLYTWNFINNDWFEAKKDSLAHGVTQQAVNEDDLRKIKMIIPAESIFKDFNKKIENFYIQISNNRQQNQELIKFRKFLFPMLMNGQITTSQE